MGEVLDPEILAEAQRLASALNEAPNLACRDSIEAGGGSAPAVFRQGGILTRLGGDLLRNGRNLMNCCCEKLSPLWLMVEQTLPIGIRFNTDRGLVKGIHSTPYSDR